MISYLPALSCRRDLEFYILFQQAIDNPLNTDYYLYMDSEGYQTFAQSSFAFMSFVFSLTPGTILHVGDVIDYHF